MVLTINGFDFPMSQDDAWDVINYARERMIVVQPGEEIQPDMIILDEELSEVGSMIKNIGTGSRIAIEKFLNSKVNLKLNVLVKTNWRDESTLLINYGFDTKLIK